MMITVFQIPNPNAFPEGDPSKWSESAGRHPLYPILTEPPPWDSFHFWGPAWSCQVRFDYGRSSLETETEFKWATVRTIIHIMLESIHIPRRPCYHCHQMFSKLPSTDHVLFSYPGTTWRRQWCGTGSGTTTWSTTSPSTPSSTSTRCLAPLRGAGARITRTSVACAASNRHQHLIPWVVGKIFSFDIHVLYCFSLFHSDLVL